MPRTRWPRPPFSQSLQHLTLNQGTQGLQLGQTRFRGWGRELLITFKAHEHVGMVIDQCRFRGEPNPADGINHVKWAIRAYGIRDQLISRSEFRNIGIEHAIYENIEGGDIEVSDCYFENIAAQGCQFVYRSSESPRPQDPVDGTEIRVIDNIFKRCTSPHTGRAAFTITAVYMNRGLLVQGNTMIAQFPPNSAGKQSRGAIVAEGLPQVTVLDTKIDYMAPDRPIVQLHDNYGPLVIEDCNFKRGMVSIRRHAGSVTFQNNRGGAWLYVDGVNRGRVTDNFYA